MQNKISTFIHWTGFLISLFMFILAYLDPSRDEVIIHITAALMPNTIGWILASSISGQKNYLPFL